MAAPLSWHFESLPSSQKNVWDTKLAGGMEGWVLYRGTGLALRLGHRESVDFDFFSSQRMEPLRFHAEMGFDGDILQATPNTLTVMHAGVKLSFFGGLSLGVVASADSLDLCPIASLADLGACKLAALVNRVERKDYQDVAALLRHGLRLPHLLGCAEAVYHGAFPTAACLKSLTWFDDPVLARLSEEDRRLLEGAALAVEKIETVPLLSDRISPTTLGRQKN